MKRPSALARPDRGSGNNNGMWLAAAAVVLLLAGGAWATRTTWMPSLSGESAASASTASNATTAAAGTAAVVATTTPTDAIAKEPTEAERAARAAAVAGLVAEADMPLGDAVADAGAANVAGDANGAAVGNASADSVAAADTASVAAIEEVRSNANDQGNAIDTRAERRAERREARAEERREPVAVRTVPRRIAIITIGDTAVTGPARHLMEEALVDGGFEVLDADMAGVGDISVGQIPGAVGHLAQRQGVGAAVVIRAEPAGTQQLQFYGRSAEMFTANLSVKMYDAASRSPLGAGFRSPVNYTGPTADHNTREALQPNVGQVINALARYRDGNSG